MESIFSKHCYPRDLIEKCIKGFLDKILALKTIVSTIPRKYLVIARPYLGKSSLEICIRINCIMKKKLSYCNVRFVFQTQYIQNSNIFTFKVRIPLLLLSGIVYKCHCAGCNATYYGKTKRHLKVRICEKLGISTLTGKKCNFHDNSTVK